MRACWQGTFRDRRWLAAALQHVRQDAGASDNVNSARSGAGVAKLARTKSRSFFPGCRRKGSQPIHRFSTFFLLR